MAEINAVKATLPQGAFELSVDALDLSASIVEALAPLGNVGEIMWRFLIDESYLRQLLSDLPSDSLSKLQSALDKVVIPEATEIAPPVVEEIPVVEEQITAPAAVEADVMAEDEEIIDAFVDEPGVVTPALPIRKPQQPAAQVAQPVAEPSVVDLDEDDEEEPAIGDKPVEGGQKKKKERQKRRQLVFDETSGEVVSKRRRKGRRSGGREDWDDYLG
jgi:hypothetical protein